MSTKYHIDGRVYKADYIRRVYREHFEKALDTFCYYFGVRLPIQLKKISIKFPSEDTTVKSKTKLADLGEKVIVKPELHLETKSGDISFYDLLHTIPAHEAAEIIFWSIRPKLDNITTITNKFFKFYRRLSEIFAETYRTIYCEKYGFEFNPLHVHGQFSRIIGAKHSPEYESFYVPASKVSKVLRKRSLKYRLSFLRALLLQKYDLSEEDPTKLLENVVQKTFNYVKERTIP